MVDVFVNSIVSFTIADSWMVDNWSSNQALTTGEEDLTAKRRVESRGRKYISPNLVERKPSQNVSFAFPKPLPPLSDSISVSIWFGYSMLFFKSPFFATKNTHVPVFCLFSSKFCK